MPPSKSSLFSDTNEFNMSRFKFLILNPFFFAHTRLLDNTLQLRTSANCISSLFKVREKLPDEGGREVRVEVDQTLTQPQHGGCPALQEAVALGVVLESE